MRALLLFLAGTLVNAAVLYPLLFAGVGRPVSWPLVAGMAGGGIFCWYLLIRYRKRL